MKLSALRVVQRLSVGLPETWAFFSDPRNLERITPPDLKFEIASDLPGRMHPGMIVVYRIRLLSRLSVDWVTEITHVREPHLFVDEQRFGPYRFWHHQHHFRAIAGGTEMEDIVHYALPFGAAGRIFGGPPVRRRLRDIFAFRRRFLEEAFGVFPQQAEVRP